MDRPRNRILSHRQVGQQLQRRDSRHRHVSLSAPYPVCQTIESQTTHYPDGMSTSSLGYYVNRVTNLHVSRGHVDTVCLDTCGEGADSENDGLDHTGLLDSPSSS